MRVQRVNVKRVSVPVGAALKPRWAGPYEQQQNLTSCDSTSGASWTRTSDLSIIRAGESVLVCRA